MVYRNPGSGTRTGDFDREFRALVTESDRENGNGPGEP